MTIETVPFTTPNFVLLKMPPRHRQEGFQELPKLALSDVPADELSAMCDQFRRDIFKKAAKQDPLGV
jgi:hypothetical protein